MEEEEEEEEGAAPLHPDSELSSDMAVETVAGWRSDGQKKN